MATTAYLRGPHSLRNTEYTLTSAHYPVFNFCSTEDLHCQCFVATASTDLPKSACSPQHG